MREPVRISIGNTKIGKIPNVNLTPIVSCEKGVPCSKDCYAIKFYRLYKNAKTAWDLNLQMYKSDPMFFFNSIGDQLKRKKEISRFRWHSSGDIVD